MEFDHLVDSFRLLRRESPLVSQLSLHLVGSELATSDLTLIVEDGALALAVVVAPLTIVDCLIGLAVVATAARSFAINEVAHVDIVCFRVLHSTLLVFTVSLPVTLVY
jgi:hypothetical protein